MKKDIAEFVAQCPNYQQVKIKHQKPSGLLQEIEIPTLKWEMINMDFITGLPRTQWKYDYMGYCRQAEKIGPFSSSQDYLFG